MSSSPAVRTPLDPKEQPILDKLLSIRDKLLLLKQDKSTYIKSPDVVEIYNSTIEQVQLLNSIRASKSNEHNRVDSVLEDCFQLISLFFLTVGRNNEAPAVYAALSTIKRLLDHLGEVGFYSEKDLESIGETMAKIHSVVERGKDSYSPSLLTLLIARIETCDVLLKERRKLLAVLSPELSPLYEKLISILRSMSAANTKQKFSTTEVKGLRDQLLEIQKIFEEKSYAGSNPDASAGQEEVKDLLDRCIPYSEIVLERRGVVGDNFKSTYEKLREIRNHLERLSLTQAWALRETDLYSFQRQLDRYDESRVNGNFMDESGNPADLFTQRTLLYLIRRSYAYIYFLIIASEPVSEALLPIFNQLQTLKRCLAEVQRSGGVTSPRELYPYTMKLNSIDSMRVDGKFMVGSDVPEGQGSVNALFAECFELSRELRVSAEGSNETSKEN